MFKEREALLVLEDGKEFRGYSLGSKGETFGEVVFNTSLTGYQEIMTDPSYAGQIVTMTYPEIGNYGLNQEDNESGSLFIEGFVVREASRVHSNWRGLISLNEYLKDRGITAITGIDTRLLTRHIRLEGAMKGGISTEELDAGRLLKKVKEAPSIIGRDLVKEVTVNEPYWWEGASSGDYKIVAYDSGIKFNILRELKKLGCAVYVVPAGTPPEKALSECDADGVFFANGPGDPSALPYLYAALRYFLGKKPVFGICLGNQMLSLALGGKTFKLKFGHRGGNQPVKNLMTGRVEITSQNHGFAVDPVSLGINIPAWKIGETFPDEKNLIGETEFGRVQLTHINLNDGTVEGIRCLDIPAFSVQYHPEASPGPHDSKYLFGDFIDSLKIVRH